MNIKKTHILSLLSLLAMAPSASAWPSTKNKNTQKTIGILVGAACSATSFANLKFVEWIAQECAKKTDACNINYIPAIAAGAIIEAASFIGWKKILSYATSNSKEADIFCGITNLCALPAIVSLKLFNLGIFTSLRIASGALLFCTGQLPQINKPAQQPEIITQII